MLKEEQVNTIKALLCEGVAGRKIARDLEVSRGVVYAIKHGRRPDYDAQRLEAQMMREYLGRPTIWCPTCRREVKGPCLACQLRERPILNRRVNLLQALTDSVEADDPENSDLSLNLEEGEQQRLNELIERRTLSSEAPQGVLDVERTFEFTVLSTRTMNGTRYAKPTKKQALWNTVKKPKPPAPITHNTPANLGATSAGRAE